MVPRSWIRQKLKRAASLHKKGVLNEDQYSYLAIRFGYQLMRQPLSPGTEIASLTFGVRLSEYLKVPHPPSDEDYAQSFRTYGPYNRATIRFKSIGEQHLDALKPRNLQESTPVLRWTSESENASKQAELWLSPFNRSGFYFQSWWQEQEHTFPVPSKAFLFILGLILGAIVGRLTR